MRRLLALLILFGVCTCAACAHTEGDWFAPFQGDYRADLDGTANGVAFAAILAVSAPDENGARTATMTFYAPEGLRGAKLARDAAGTLTLHKDDWSLANVPVGALECLLDLFPTAGEVQAVEMTDSGNTRVTGEGFVLELRADGTPATVETPSARATVVAWQAW